MAKPAVGLAVVFTSWHPVLMPFVMLAMYSLDWMNVGEPRNEHLTSFYPPQPMLAPQPPQAPPAHQWPQCFEQEAVWIIGFTLQSTPRRLNDNIWQPTIFNIRQDFFFKASSLGLMKHSILSFKSFPFSFSLTAFLVCTWCLSLSDSFRLSPKC